METDMISEQGAANLCTAVIRKAVEDYKEAVEVLNGSLAAYRNLERAKDIYSEIMRFFSSWEADLYLGIIGGMDGKDLASILKRKFGDADIKKQSAGSRAGHGPMH